ncbi:MAG: HAD-IA family hydrolase [Woeseiaceae bacterium]|nr:HAD-IA family hydrolase [Woeseiaceae bacterium]
MEAPYDPSPPALILFDFGGVLLHLNDPVETFGFGHSHEEFNRLWLDSPAVRAHETGRVEPETFARRIVRDMGLPYSWQEFLQRFAAWPDRVHAVTSQLVQGIPREIDCAILSNTNALHWHVQDIERDFGGRISRCFLSFESGLIKPDAGAFTQVFEATDHRPGDILFIDDNPKNIEAARLQGMRTQHCANVFALGDILQAEGLLARRTVV